MNEQWEMAVKANKAATAKYNAKFNNVTFLAATEGKSSPYANALIDDSLALCGSPHYKLSNRRWSKDALAHLQNFA